MAVALLLTVLGTLGVWLGIYLGRIEKFAGHLAAAGGGLLFGISFFWLTPEIAQSLGTVVALALTAGVALILGLIDELLAHSGHSARQGVIWPIMAATAIHSTLDGWSVRLMITRPVTDVATVLGLALHKLPEGAALGWITKRSVRSAQTAFVAGTLPELFTLAGAAAEPTLNARGTAQFGAFWSSGVLCVIAGGFLFLGFHSIWPTRRQLPALAVFFLMLLLMAAIRSFRGLPI
jgi:hypothetical protein